MQISLHNNIPLHTYQRENKIRKFQTLANRRSHENVRVLLVGVKTVTTSWRTVQQNQSWKSADLLTQQFLFCLYTVEKFLHTCTRSA